MRSSSMCLAQPVPVIVCLFKACIQFGEALFKLTDFFLKS